MTNNSSQRVPHALSGLSTPGALVIALAMTGCSADGPSENPEPEGDKPTPTDVAPFGSGTRLKANYYDGGEGAIRFKNWFDSELGSDCRFGYDRSGDIRCIPGRSVSAPRLFADTACTEPLQDVNYIWNEPGRPELTHVSAPLGGEYLAPAADCGKTAWADSVSLQALESFELGAPHPATSPVYGRDVDGNCIDWGTGMPMVALTAVSDATLASATVSRVAVDSGIGVRYIETAGGARQGVDLYSVEHDLPCTVHNVGGEVLCVPGPIARVYGPNYVDSACSDPLMYSNVSTDCATPAYTAVDVDSGATCGEAVLELHTVGEPHEGVHYSNADGGSSCTEATANEDDNVSFWALGTAAAVDDIPRAERVQSGTDRLRLNADATVLGSTLFPASNSWADRLWQDMERGDRCHLDWGVRDDSGVLLCLPAGTRSVDGLERYYTDASCKGQEVASAWGVAEPCDETRATVAMRTIDDVLEFRPFGAVYTADLYTTDADGACTLVPPKTNENAPTVFLEDAIPVTSFAAVAVRTEQ